MTDEYRTPEGFTLYRPLLLPDVRDFAQVLTVEERWNHDTMSHKWGKPGPDHKPNVSRPGWEKTAGRFCSFRGFPDKRPAAVVTPTDAVLDLIFPESDSLGEPFAFFDVVQWEAIYHPANDRVLITGSASSIIASRFIAYVDPATVPQV